MFRENPSTSKSKSANLTANKKVKRDSKNLRSTNTSTREKNTNLIGDDQMDARGDQHKVERDIKTKREMQGG